MSTPQIPLTLDQISAQSNFNGPQGNTMDSGPAVIPQPPAQQIPMAPAPGTAPDIQQPDSSLDGVDLMAHAFLTHLLQRTPPPPPQAQRGGFADKLSSAINGVGASLGDAAHATDNLRSGQGWLSGVENTMAARNSRIATQKQQSVENQERQQRLDMEKQKTQVEIASANVRMVYEQKLVSQLDEEAVNASISDGQKAVAAMKTAPVPGQVIAEGLTSDEMQTQLAQKKIDPTTVTPYPTGKKQVGENPDGSPIYRTTYSVVKPPAEITLDDKNRAPLSGIPEFDKLTPGTKISGSLYNTLFQQSADIKAATAARDKTLADNEIAADQTDQKLESVRIGPEWLNALANHQNDPVAALKTMLSDPAMRQKYPHLEADVQQAYGGAKEFETIRHNRAEEANKAAELAQKKQQVVTSNLSGEDYLKTLPVAQQGMVRAVAEGRQVLPANRKEALALLEQVHQAYPDYDESKGKTWQKVSNEYRGSGQTAKKVVSYNTALEHMQDLYNNTNAEGIFNPLSKAHQDREVAMGYVANEVGNAIKNGVMSKEEGQKILSDLSGGITPENKRERIAETARLLHDKIEEYQNKFAEGAPSAAVKVPMLISPRAAASYDYVQSGGKVQQPQPSPKIAPPVGVPQGSVLMQAPGGQPHWIPPQNIDAARKAGASEVK